jgi:hypothetical protein
MVSVFLATHLVDILRGTRTDEYGDDADHDVVVYSGVPCSITDAARRNWDRATGLPRTVRWYVGRFRPGTDLRAGDRVRDRRTGIVYQVDSLAELAPVGGSVDVICDMERVTKTG